MGQTEDVISFVEHAINVLVQQYTCEYCLLLISPVPYTNTPDFKPFDYLHSRFCIILDNTVKKNTRNYIARFFHYLKVIHCV